MPTDEEIAERLRQQTEKLRATLDERDRTCERLDAVVGRLTARYLPPKRPDHLWLVRDDVSD